MDEMKYNLVRDEVADLFRVGKLMRDTDTNKEVLHKMLSHLGQPKPHLQPRQVVWWYKALYSNSIEIPDWLFDAKTEMDYNTLNDVE